MNVMKTQKGSQIYQILSGKNNVYLVHSGADWILVDSGLSRFYPKLKHRLQKLLPPKAPLSLFLTHTHYDHTQNAHALKEDFNCRIIVSKQENEFTKLGRSPLPKGTNLFAKLVVFLGESVGKSQTGFAPFQSDIVVDKDSHFSSSVKIILTPGHTIGSQSLIVDDELAFVGDAMFGVFKNSIFPPFADDIPTMIQSWKKLQNSGCDVFYPGHGRKINKSELSKEMKKHAKFL